MRWEMLTDARRILIAHIERIGDELRRSLDYVRQEFDDASVTRVLTVGEGARLPGLDECLGELAGVDVHVVNAGDVASTPLDLAPTCATPLLCPALGLALYPRRSS